MKDPYHQNWFPPAEHRKLARPRDHKMKLFDYLDQSVRLKSCAAFIFNRGCLENPNQLGRAPKPILIIVLPKKDPTPAQSKSLKTS
jgi:hypothetical protein